MVKVYLIYYSLYGHIRTMAQAIKEGAAEVEGVELSMFQIPETLPEEVLVKMHAPPKSDEPVITAAQLTEADAFIFGFPTRFGCPCGQFKAFWDATGGHWASGALTGKPFSMFVSSATQNGGQESTHLTALPNFIHHGMIYVPSGTCCPGTQFDLSEVHGGSAYGPSTLAGGDGSRQPSEMELAHAKAAGKYWATQFKRIGPKV